MLTTHTVVLVVIIALVCIVAIAALVIPDSIGAEVENDVRALSRLSADGLANALRERVRETVFRRVPSGEALIEAAPLTEAEMLERLQRALMEAMASRELGRTAGAEYHDSGLARISDELQKRVQTKSV